MQKSSMQESTPSTIIAAAARAKSAAWSQQKGSSPHRLGETA